MKNDFQYGGYMEFLHPAMWHVALGWHAIEFAQTSSILQFYIWFPFPHITAVDMSFCTSLRNFIQIGPPSAEKNDVMSIFKMVNFHYTGLYRSSIETIALNCLVFEKIACLHFGDRQTDGQSQRIKPLSSWQLVHEWSTFVDDTQTGWDQTLAPVPEAAIDLLSVQGLLPEKVTVK